MSVRPQRTIKLIPKKSDGGSNQHIPGLVIPYLPRKTKRLSPETPTIYQESQISPTTKTKKTTISEETSPGSHRRNSIKTCQAECSFPITLRRLIILCSTTTPKEDTNTTM